MKRNAEVSLIIATYNWPEYLPLCPESVCRQTTVPAEGIIADHQLRTQVSCQEYPHHAAFLQSIKTQKVFRNPNGIDRLQH